MINFVLQHKDTLLFLFAIATSVVVMLAWIIDRFWRVITDDPANCTICGRTMTLYPNIPLSPSIWTLKENVERLQGTLVCEHCHTTQR